MGVFTVINTNTAAGGAQRISSLSYCLHFKKHFLLKQILGQHK